MNAKGKLKAMLILDRFDRGVISATNFTWEYIAEKVGCSRQTLWRDQEIYLRYGELSNKLSSKKKVKNDERQNARRASEKERLSLYKEKVSDLENKLEVAQIRIIELQRILLQNDIDPYQVFTRSFKKHKQA